MKSVVQRVQSASVTVADQTVGSIERGMLVLLGVSISDTAEQAAAMARKVAALRLFPDADGVPNLSLVDTGLSALVISQFTLLADTRKGNRPGYSQAAPPERAEPLYECFVSELRGHIGTERVATGRFRASMQVSLVNDGPFTLILEIPAA